MVRHVSPLRRFIVSGGSALLARCAYDNDTDIVRRLEGLSFMPREDEVCWGGIILNGGFEVVVMRENTYISAS